MRIPSNTDDGFPVIGVESVFSWGYQACMLRSQAPISVAAIAVTGRSFWGDGGSSCLEEASCGQGWWSGSVRIDTVVFERPCVSKPQDCKTSHQKIGLVMTRCFFFSETFNRCILYTCLFYKEWATQTPAWNICKCSLSQLGHTLREGIRLGTLDMSQTIWAELNIYIYIRTYNIYILFLV